MEGKIGQQEEGIEVNKIRTVLGDIDSGKMGSTYTHEHIYCNPYTARKDPTLAITDIEKSIEELKRFKDAGGSTLVEGTAIDYGRNPEKLAYASHKSEVHLIATTGYYLHDYNPQEIDEIEPEDIAEKLICDIQEGMDGTHIKAGQIKCAVSLRFIHQNEKKCLKAAAMAQKETKAPIWIHHGGMLGTKILNILEEAGADLEKVVLGHMDRNPDPYEYRKIASMGCYMSIDNIARVYRYPIQTNINMLGDLIDLGYLNKIVISGDFGRSDYFESNGGGPGLTYLLKQFIPRIQESLTLSDDDIQQIMVKNPQKIYGCF